MSIFKPLSDGRNHIPYPHFPGEDLVPVLGMENQCADLNALPPILSLSLRIHKRGVWHTTRPPIRLRIEAFNQSHQFRRLSIPVIPFDIRIRLDGERLALAIRIDELHPDEVTLRYRVRISHSQRIFEDRLDRAPDINDLVSSFQELWGFVGEVVANAFLGCFVGLINVHALDGTARLVPGPFVLCCATNSMVEYKDSGAASSANVSVLLGVGARWGEVDHIRVLEQLLRLWIVFLSDLLFIQKALLSAFVVIELEPMAIEGIVEFVTTDVVDGCRDSGYGFIVGSRIVNIVWAWWRAILVLFEEVQCRLNMMRFVEDGGGWLLRQGGTMSYRWLNSCRRHLNNLIL